MSEQLAQRIQRHNAATLTPSDPRFRNLNSLILLLEEQLRWPRRTVVQLRKRWIEGHIPINSSPSKGGC
jgi:hypothetical protein